MAPVKLTWVIFILTMAMLILSGLAHYAPHQVPVLGPMPGDQPASLFPLSRPLVAAKKCWALIIDKGCLFDIKNLAFGIKNTFLSKTCCQAINQLSDTCWFEIFPLNPFMPPLLKSFCAAKPDGLLRKTMSMPRLLPNPTTNQCFSSLTHDIQGCIVHIYKSLSTSQIESTISRNCCNDMNKILKNCWQTLFPFNPYFPPLLKAFCSNVLPMLQEEGILPNTPVPGMLPPLSGIDIIKCWSSLNDVQNCVVPIQDSFYIGHGAGIGKACCKAINEIHDNCWSNMFPFNPFFPTLLKSFCVGTAPTPK